MKPYYKTLCVEETASPEEIKRAYRRLARKYHPDVSKEDNAEAKFKEIQEAYDALYDPVKRKNYDETGEAKLPPLEERARAHVVELIVSYVMTYSDEGPMSSVLNLNRPFQPWIRGVLHAELVKHCQNETEGKHMLAKLERAAKRVKFKGEGTDFVMIALETHMQTTRDKLKTVAENIACTKLCGKYAELYDYQVDDIFKKAPTLQVGRF